MIIDEKIKFKIENFNLYLNIIGGHSLFIEIDKKYLIKSSNESEINFYKFSKIKKFTPKFFGIIEKNSIFFSLISDYVRQLKLFFKYFLLKYKLNENLINIENDKNFHSIFNLFIFNENKKININELLPSFFSLEKKLLNLYENNSNKFKWILFWFVKWNKNFLKNHFIIIENLTNKMIKPAIIDIKLGNSPKINKISNEIKIFNGAINEIKCRIMGIQKENIFFNKYDTKNFNLNEFKEILNVFFDKKDLIKIILFKIVKIIDEIKNVKININFSSLLIIYDEKIENNKILLNLIDFSFVEENKNNNLIEPIKNFMNILKKLENFNEINLNLNQIV